MHHRPAGSPGLVVRVHVHLGHLERVARARDLRQAVAAHRWAVSVAGAPRRATTARPPRGTRRLNATIGSRPRPASGPGPSPEPRPAPGPSPAAPAHPAHPRSPAARPGGRGGHHHGAERRELGVPLHDRHRRPGTCSRGWRGHRRPRTPRPARPVPSSEAAPCTDVPAAQVRRAPGLAYASAVRRGTSRPAPRAGFVGPSRYLRTQLSMQLDEQPNLCSNRFEAGRLSPSRRWLATARAMRGGAARPARHRDGGGPWTMLAAGNGPAGRAAGLRRRRSRPPRVRPPRPGRRRRRDRPRRPVCRRPPGRPARGGGHRRGPAGARRPRRRQEGARRSVWELLPRVEPAPWPSGPRSSPPGAGKRAAAEAGLTAGGDRARGRRPAPGRRDVPVAGRAGAGGGRPGGAPAAQHGVTPAGGYPAMGGAARV